MGIDWSSNGKNVVPEKYVVVPPILDIDREQKNRMLYSSYDFVGRRRDLAYLLEHFFQEGASAVVNMIPPSDRGLAITAKFWEKERATEARQSFGGVYAGGLNVRWQPDERNPLSFASLNTNFKGSLRPALAAAFFDLDSGVGCFGQAQLSHQGADDLEVGVRYASTSTSSGVVLNAAAKQLKTLWLVSRLGSLTFGAQFEPGVALDSLRSDPATFAATCVSPETSSACVAYSPTASTSSADGDRNFSIMAEVEKGLVFRMSIFQHYARVRRVYNLFEDDDVVGITNYLDLGLSVTSALAEPSLLSTEASSLQAAVAWQVNSNVLLKARVGTDKVAAAVVLKSWWNPSFTFAASGGWNLKSGWPCLGIMLNMDTDSELRYERGRQTRPVGSLVRQRHVASEAETQVDANYRPIVREEVGAETAPAPPTPPPEVLDRLSRLL